MQHRHDAVPVNRLLPSRSRSGVPGAIPDCPACYEWFSALTTKIAESVLLDGLVIRSASSVVSDLIAAGGNNHRHSKFWSIVLKTDYDLSGFYIVDIRYRDPIIESSGFSSICLLERVPTRALAFGSAVLSAQPGLLTEVAMHGGTRSIVCILAIETFIKYPTPKSIALSQVPGLGLHRPVISHLPLITYRRRQFVAPAHLQDQINHFYMATRRRPPAGINWD